MEQQMKGEQMDHNKGMTTNLDKKHLRHVEVHCMRENQCLLLLKNSSAQAYKMHSL
jgi:hypothetical protein